MVPLQGGSGSGTMWHTKLALKTGGEDVKGQQNLYLVQFGLDDKYRSTGYINPGQASVNGKPLIPDSTGPNWGDMLVSAPGQTAIAMTPTTSATPYYLIARKASQVEPQLTCISGAKPIDSANCAAVKTTVDDYVYIQASFNPSDAWIAAEAGLYIQWTGGEPVPGNPLRRKVTKGTAAKKTVTATLGSATASIDVWVISATIKSLEFTSDHALLLDNHTDWTDTGARYTKPEWVAGASINNPISQTMNTRASVKATVNVQPPGLPFDIFGDSDGGDNYLDFPKLLNVATGSDQQIAISALGDLPDSVGFVGESIKWSIEPFHGALNCTLASSGPHMIYITYDTPSGSTKVTEIRVARVCLVAAGCCEPNAIANKIGNDAMVNYWQPSYSIYPGATQAPDYDNAWEIMGYNGKQGADCISDATLMSYELDMLGVTGSQPICVQPCHNSWAWLVQPHGGSAETDVPESASGILGYLYGGVFNNFEGCCRFNGKYWPGGQSGATLGTAWDVLNSVSGPNSISSGNHQAYLDHLSTVVTYPDPSGRPAY